VIVVDTSALMAILLAEDGAESCAEVIAQATGLQMSGGTMAECMVVAARRGLRSEMGRLMNGIDLEIVEVTADRARTDDERSGEGAIVQDQSVLRDRELAGGVVV